MTRDPSAVEPSLVELVRELSLRAGRPAQEIEVRAALAPLSREEQAGLRRWSKGEPPARPLGPLAWADVARGVEPGVAAARETSGYYTLQAERDALAALLRGRDAAAPRPAAPAPAAAEAEAPAAAAPRPGKPAPARRLRPAPPPAAPEPEEDGPRARQGREAATREQRTQQLLTLFAYHRDAPLVARALSLTLAGLDEEIERLKLRRQTRRLLRGTDAELPVATPRKGPAGPPVRRRSAQEKQAAKALRAAPAEPPPAAPELPPAPARGRVPARPSPAQATELKAVLREVGPRRRQLAERLAPGGTPLSPAALLARFRAAGLEREFGQRERDLVRALLSRHKAAFGPAAAELGVTTGQLQDLIRERGLAREVEALRDRERRAARAARWPQGRIDLWLRERERLADLGVLDELDNEVQARVALLWGELERAGGAGEAKLAKALHLPAADARALIGKLGLR